MQRSMYWSRSKREAMISRVSTSWIAAFGTELVERVVEIVEAIVWNDKVVSFPPLWILASFVKDGDG